MQREQRMRTANVDRLTDRQREIYLYMRGYTETYGYSPSIDEIRKHFGLASLATVHKHLGFMEKKGAIRRRPHHARAIEFCNKDDPRQQLEMLKSENILRDEIAKGITTAMDKVSGLRNSDIATVLRLFHERFVQKREELAMRLDGDGVVLRKITSAM